MRNIISTCTSRESRELAYCPDGRIQPNRVQQRYDAGLFQTLGRVHVSERPLSSAKASSSVAHTRQPICNLSATYLSSTKQETHALIRLAHDSHGRDRTRGRHMPLASNIHMSYTGTKYSGGSSSNKLVLLLKHVQRPKVDCGRPNMQQQATHGDRDLKKTTTGQRQHLNPINQHETRADQHTFMYTTR